MVEDLPEEFQKRFNEIRRLDELVEGGELCINQMAKKTYFQKWAKNAKLWLKSYSTVRRQRRNGKNSSSWSWLMLDLKWCHLIGYYCNSETESHALVGRAESEHCRTEREAHAQDF